MDKIREKLVELLQIAGVRNSAVALKFADSLIANGVTVQENAHWEQIFDCGIGNCYGICSNCLTQHKANSYAALIMGQRYCKWCGAKMLYKPIEGE